MVCTDPEEDGGRDQADALHDAVVGHDDETAPEKFLRDGEELVQHHVAKDRLGRRRFHRFDSLDRVDLMRAVFSLALLDAGEKRAQHFLGEEHQPAIERRREEEREHERRAVDRHQPERARQLHEREDGADAVLDRKLPDLPGAIKPALNVAGAPAREITHRQGKHLPAEKIEDRRIQPNGGERKQIFLRE